MNKMSNGKQTERWMNTRTRKQTLKQKKSILMNNLPWLMQNSKRLQRNLLNYLHPTKLWFKQVAAVPAIEEEEVVDADQHVSVQVFAQDAKDFATILYVRLKQMEDVSVEQRLEQT